MYLFIFIQSYYNCRMKCRTRFISNIKSLNKYHLSNSNNPFKNKTNSNSFVNEIVMGVRDTARINKNSHQK